MPTCIPARRCWRLSKPPAKRAISRAPPRSRTTSPSARPRSRRGWCGSTTTPTGRWTGTTTRTDKTNIFRPWGYQPGHLTEWAKLLLILERHRASLESPSDWLAPRAAELFDAALAKAWDAQHGGIAYGFAPDGSICDGDKYFWVQAESLAAAALLAQRTGRQEYWRWYDRIWAYSWEHFVDHEYGAWYRILTPDNRKYSDEKSPAGKTDYHTMGACYEVLNVLGTPATRP